MFGGGGVSNKTSRLYRALIDKGLAVSVHGGSSATIDPFLYSFVITAHPEKTPEIALAALDEEIERIQHEPPSPGDVARAIKQARAMFAFGTENITNQAFWLAYAEMFADYSWFTSYLERLAAVTPADVQRVARTYLRTKNRIVGTYLPVGDEDRGGKWA
jgi:zinc protease